MGAPTLVDLLAPLEEEGAKAVVLTWFKAVGDSVTENEPVVELETDKVAIEVAAPTTGRARRAADRH